MTTNVFFLQNNLQSLSGHQRQHRFKIDDYEFLVLEELLGYQLHMGHQRHSKIFIYLPYVYFSRDTFESCPIGTVQTWKLVAAQRGTSLGPCDIEITSDLDSITIDDHIYSHTFVNHNQTMDYQIKNDNYNIFIVQGQDQPNQPLDPPQLRRRRRGRRDRQ